MYQVIARKYRPQTFDQVVGQTHVKQTLRNAIDQGRIAHGYIFSGPRGTGKTTTARILAMALNCEDGPSSSFDPESRICKEIADGGTLDVIEIDAASNRGIDDIRELREGVRFRPARDRYKVYVIDEAHQITKDAFNALLKTLEEPPEWAVFVLCTTEPQSVPATISSRCQSFAFRSVELPLVIGHLRYICRSEGVEAVDDALTALALAGDGSMRDSLSALDQAIAAFGRQLEAQDVRDLLGAIPSEVTDRILAAIRDSDPAGMLGVVDELFRDGRHPQHFCGELTRQFRNLMVMKFAGTDSNLVVAGEREREAASNWINDFSTEDLTRYVQILLSLYQDLQHSTQERFRLEVGLLKLVYAGRLRPIEELLSGIGPGEPAKPAGRPPGKPRSALRATKPKTLSLPTQPEPRPRPSTVSHATARESPPSPPARNEPARSSGQSVAESQAATAASTAHPQETAVPVSRTEDLKQKLVRTIEESGDSAFAAAIRASRVEGQERVVTVHLPSDCKRMMRNRLDKLEAALAGLVGGNQDVRLVFGEAGASASDRPKRLGPGESRSSTPVEVDVRQRALADPSFRQFEIRFEGRVQRVLDLRG